MLKELKTEGSQVEDSFGNLPGERPGSCPEHPDVKMFVRVPYTSAYICPRNDHEGGKGGTALDKVPWSSLKIY